jgi:hypothetical protein
MRFRLYYRGNLQANARPNQKAELRREFHKQLEVLWSQDPFIDMSKYIDANYVPNDCYLGEERRGTIFYPIVSEKIWTIAELDILMLRPGNPGSIWVGGGDIDNRLKTLFDSLKVPDAGGPHFHEDQSQLFCLLQDDKLITRVSVETDRLLDPDPVMKNEVILVIQVNLLASSGRNCNIAITL